MSNFLIENENNNNKSITWLSISNGKIVTKVEEGTPKSVKRINKAGVEVWERFYDSVVGKIKTIDVLENKFGETQISVGIENGDNYGVLGFNLDSSYGRSFLKQIFNVDLSRDIIFAPWQKIDGDKKVTRLYLSYSKQHKVEEKYPEGTPEIKFVDSKKGKLVDTLSKAQHDEFLEDKLKQFIETNGLVYQKSEKEIVEQPLSKEEMKELKSLKKTASKNTKEKDVFDDLEDMDELFFS